MRNDRPETSAVLALPPFATCTFSREPCACVTYAGYLRCSTHAWSTLDVSQPACPVIPGSCRDTISKIAAHASQRHAKRLLKRQQPMLERTRTSPCHASVRRQSGARCQAACLCQVAGDPGWTCRSTSARAVTALPIGASGELPSRSTATTTCGVNETDRPAQSQLSVYLTPYKCRLYTNTAVG